MNKTKLGETLVNAGVISEEHLFEALQDQKTYGGRLASILLEKCYITEQEYFEALTGQLGITAVDISSGTIPESVIKMVPYELADKHAVFPYGVKKTAAGRKVVLAMADPSDKIALAGV